MAEVLEEIVKDIEEATEDQSPKTEQDHEDAILKRIDSLMDKKGSPTEKEDSDENYKFKDTVQEKTKASKAPSAEVKEEASDELKPLDLSALEGDKVEAEPPKELSPIEQAKEDPAITVDLDKLKDGPKTSILNLKAQRDEERVKAKELQSKLTQLETTLKSRPTEDKFKELEDEAGLLRQRLGYHDVTETPEFNSKVTVPRQEILETLTDLALSYGIDSNEITRAISMPIKNRIEFLKENYPDFMPASGHHFAILDRLSIAEKNMREKHPEILQAYKQQLEEQRVHASAQETENRTKQLQAHLNDSLKVAEKMNNPFFIKTGIEEHDAKVDALVKQNEAIFMSNNAGKIFEYAVLGSSVPAYHDELIKATTRIRDLEGKLSKMQKVSPGESGKSSSTSNGKDGKKKTLEERVDSYFG